MIDPRVWYSVIAGACALVLLGLILSVGKCGRDRTAERQAEQTTRSGQAASQAGSAAVQIVATTAAGEAATDRDTAQTVGVIHEAPDADAVRRAVLDRLCKQDAHRLDAACRVR